MDRNIRSIVVALGVINGLAFFPPLAFARTWTDPDWSTMLAKSDVIVLAEVTEGGKFEAKVKSLKTFKGESPQTPFWVDDFNDSQTDVKSIDAGQFKVGERYYLFLLKRRTYIESFVEEFAKSNPDFAKELRAGRVFRVWTPSAGAFARVGDKVAYSLHTTSYSRCRGGEQSAEQFETLIDKALNYLTRKKLDIVYLDGTYNSLAAEYAGKEKADLGRHLLALQLSGEHRYRELFADLAKHESANVRVPLARLLGQIDDPRGQALLLTMLKDKHAIGEAVRQLAKGDPKVIGPALMAELPTAANGGLGANGLMDPVRNQMAGALVEIVRVLGEIKHRPAAKDLLPLLEQSDNHLIAVTVEALRQLDNHEYVPYLAKQLKRGDYSTTRVITAMARKWKLTGLKSEFESYLEDVKNDNPYDRSDVIVTLAEVGDEGSAKILLKDLNRYLAKPNANNFNDEEPMTELVAALGKLKYTPAKAAVYETVFFWFGFDDTFTAYPSLFRGKKVLEELYAMAALKSVPDLKDAKADAFVFWENRKETVQSSEVRAKYRVLVNVQTTSSFPSDDSVTKVREQIAKALKIPLHDVGLTSDITKQGRIVDGVDARLYANRAQFLMWHVCQFLSHSHDDNDARFLHWAVANGRLERELASEIIPELFPPKK